MSLPECYAKLNPQPTKEELVKRKYFLSLCSGLNLPKHRVLDCDYNWIMKYGPKKNPDSKNTFKAIRLLA